MRADPFDCEVDPLYRLSLRAHRKGLSLSQRELAVRIAENDASRDGGGATSPDTHRKMISQVEGGKLCPSKKDLARLALALGCREEELEPSKVTLERFAYLLGRDRKEWLRPLDDLATATDDLLADYVVSNPATGVRIGRALRRVTWLPDVQDVLLNEYKAQRRDVLARLDEAARALRDQEGWGRATPRSSATLQEYLEHRWNYRIVEFDEGADLGPLQWVFDRRGPTLHLHRSLSNERKAFLLAREVGYAHAGDPNWDGPRGPGGFELAAGAPLAIHRSRSSHQVDPSYAERKNHLLASYFGGALQLDGELLIQGLQKLFDEPEWSDKGFADLMRPVPAKPYETPVFFYRLTELLPSLGLPRFQLLKFRHRPRPSSPHPISHGVQLVREYATSYTRNLRVLLDSQEHHCRRFVSMSLLRRLGEAEPNRYTITRPLVRAHRSRYVYGSRTPVEYFAIAAAYSHPSEPGTNIAMALAFEVDSTFRDKVAFFKDDHLIAGPIGEQLVAPLVVGRTCERCPIKDCNERVADLYSHGPRTHSVDLNPKINKYLYNA